MQRRTILIAMIRYMPLIYSLAVVFGACETLYAIHVGNIIDYGDYIMYDTPISDCLLGFLSTSLVELALLYLLTIVFQFCTYHRVFVWFLVGNNLSCFLATYFICQNIYVIMSFITLILFFIASCIALRLHLLHLKLNS